MRNPRWSPVPSRVILDALHSDEETFFGVDVSDDEGIDSASHVAISPDQDEPTGHDDWFSDNEQEPPKVVAAGAVGQPDIDVREEEISAEKRFPGARRHYPGKASHAILPT